MSDREPSPRSAEWILRIASAMIFAGHGAYAIGVRADWIRFFHTVRMSTTSAETLMPLIGALDLALAVVVLVRPVRIALLWMAFWAAWTAILRPLSGDAILELLERGGNWGAPLALLFLKGWPKSPRVWLS